MNRFGLAASIGLLSALAVTQAKLPPELVSRIDAFVAERMAQGQLPGLSLAVVMGGTTVFTKGYGFANLEDRTAMTDHTPVPVASNAKGLTALAIMQLVEQGRVDLDATVTTYLPWFEVSDPLGASMTVRQVLSHTAGLPASSALDGDRDPDALERRVRGLAAVEPSRAPGTGFEYANDGYAIAGLIVQTLSGMAFEDYMALHVFAPLGMSDSTFDPVEGERRGLAQGYVKQRGVLRAAPLTLSRGQAPAGWALSSAHDVARYFLMLLAGGELENDVILARSSVEELWTPIHVRDPGEPYGLGWVVSNVNGLETVSHNGSVNVGSSEFILVPSQNLGVAVLVNLSSAATTEIAQGIVALMLGGTPEPSSLPIERAPSTFRADTSAWTRYAGDYVTPKGLIRVYVAGDRLLGAAGEVAFELEAYGDNDFVMRGDVGALEGNPVSFTVDADGGMTFLLGGRPFGRKK